MEAKTLSELRDQLPRERRNLVEVVDANDDALQAISETPRREFEEHAQRERDADALEAVGEKTQQRLSEVDAALARIDAGEYAYCKKCGREISEARLRAEPTTVLCATCAEKRAERQATAPLPEEESTIVPTTGELPPDLEILDDQELAGYLEELIREDGRIDMHELQISAQKGVVYLEGALPSEPERQSCSTLSPTWPESRRPLTTWRFKDSPGNVRTARIPRTRRKFPPVICTSRNPTAARTI